MAVTGEARRTKSEERRTKGGEWGVTVGAVFGRRGEMMWGALWSCWSMTI